MEQCLIERERERESNPLQKIVNYIVVYTLLKKNKYAPRRGGKREKKAIRFAASVKEMQNYVAGGILLPTFCFPSLQPENIIVFHSR